MCHGAKEQGRYGSEREAKVCPQKSLSGFSGDIGHPKGQLEEICNLLWKWTSQWMIDYGQSRGHEGGDSKVDLSPA